MLLNWHDDTLVILISYSYACVYSNDDCYYDYLAWLSTAADDNRIIDTAETGLETEVGAEAIVEAGAQA